MVRQTGRIEARADGGFSAGSLRHYARELVRLGYIEPAAYFSHLPTDGPGAKRYVLTRAGKRVFTQLESSAPLAVIHRQSIHAKGGVNWRESSAGATIPSAPRRYSQRYVGGHNLCFRMIVEERFERPIPWQSEHPMGPKAAPRWVSRHLEYEPGVHLEEAGGSMSEGSGEAGHVIMLKFAVEARGRKPSEVEREAESRADGIRRTLEMRYGGQLSDPEIRGHPKHSFPHDPFARVIRSKGIALHGPVGVDDTPEEGTLEIEAAEKADAYLNLPEQVARLMASVGRLEAAIESMARSQETVVVAQTQILRRLVGDVHARSVPGVSGPKWPAEN